MDRRKRVTDSFARFHGEEYGFCARKSKQRTDARPPGSRVLRKPPPRARGSRVVRASATRTEASREAAAKARVTLPHVSGVTRRVSDT